MSSNRLLRRDDSNVDLRAIIISLALVRVWLCETIVVLLTCCGTVQAQHPAEQARTCVGTMS